MRGDQAAGGGSVRNAESGGTSAQPSSPQGSPLPAPLTVLTFDVSLRYTSVAGAALAQLAWRPDDIVGRLPSEILGSPDGLVLEEHMRAALGGEIRFFEHPGLRDPGLVWLSTVAPLIGQDGKVIGGSVVSQEIGAARQETETRRQLEQVAARVARLAEFEAWQRERLEFLVEINDVLGACKDRPELMRRLTAAAVPRLGDWCSIYVFMDRHDQIPAVEVAHVDPAMTAYARELQERFPYDPDAPRGVPAVIRTGEAQLLSEITPEVVQDLEVEPEAAAIVEQLQLRSSVVVPLVKRRQVIGAMQFVISGTERHYENDDLSLALAVAGRVASALDNLRLLEEQREIARILQEGLLPSSLPSINGVEVAVRYWASGAGEVGGDFFDVFELSEGDHAVVIGDVCGKGPKAASITSLARYTIRAAAWHGDEPSEVLRHLNSVLVRTLPETTCTAAYGVLSAEEDGRVFHFASAGHPLPYAVHADGAGEAVGAGGLLLGMVDDLEVSPSRVPLSVGDTLILYTDGADDLPPPANLSTEALYALFLAASVGATTAEDTATRIASALAQHQSFSERQDDTALVVIRIGASPT